MRRYDIVSGILLIIPIVDFALAAPVLVQEKRQTYIDVEHLPHEVISVLEKRGSEEIEKMVEEFFGPWGKPIESSDAYASSSSAPPGPYHGPTNVAEAPANPGPLMYNGDDELHEPLYHTPAQSEYGSDHELTGPHAPPPNPPSTDSYFDLNYWFPPLPRPSSPEEFGQAHGHQVEDVQQPNPGDSYFDLNYWFPSPPRPALLKEFGQAHENQVENVQQQPKPGPSADSDFDWNYWMNLKDTPPPRPALPKESGQAHENQVENLQQPKPVPSADSDFDWNHWMNIVNSEDPPPPRPPLPKESGQGHEDQAGNLQQPHPGPPTDDFDWNYWGNLVNPPPSNPRLSTSKLDSDRNLMAAHQPPPYPPPPTEFDSDHWHDVDSPSSDASSTTEFYSYSDPGSPKMPPPLPGLESPKEPESEVVPGPPPSPYHQPSSTDDRPVDLQATILAAIYAVKGKAKQLRRISGTTRDVENAAQRELQQSKGRLIDGSGPGESKFLSRPSLFCLPSNIHSN
jgi:hypothetical protein